MKYDSKGNEVKRAFDFDGVHLDLNEIIMIDPVEFNVFLDVRLSFKYIIRTSNNENSGFTFWDDVCPRKFSHVETYQETKDSMFWWNKSKTVEADRDVYFQKAKYYTDNEEYIKFMDTYENFIQAWHEYKNSQV